MAKEFKIRPINNTLSGRHQHTHPPDEPWMAPDVLRAHLIKYHGWTLVMLRHGRNEGSDGVDYMRHWHENDHKPMAAP